MASNALSSPLASPSIAPRRPSARASPPLLALPPPAASAASSSVALGASSPMRSSVSPPLHHPQQGQVPVSPTQRLGVRSSLATAKPRLPCLPPPVLALAASTNAAPTSATGPGGGSSGSSSTTTASLAKAPTPLAPSPTPYNSPRSPTASARRASWAPNLIAPAGGTAPFRSGAAGAAASSPRSPQDDMAKDDPSPRSPTASTAAKETPPFPFPAPPPTPPTPTRPLKVTSLPRGGSYVMTCIGPIQLGIPPETIKDALNAGLPVPRHFIVPSQRFNRQLGTAVGINVAEFEFPAYYNFFFKRQPVNLVVEPEVEARIRTVFQETLFGPQAIDYEADFAPELAPDHRPDLLKELSYFRKFGDTFLEIDMLLRFTHFNAQGVATIEETTREGRKVAVKITKSATNGGEYVIREVFEPAEQQQEQPSSSTEDDNGNGSGSGSGSGPGLPGVATLSGIILLRNHQMYGASASLSASSIGGGGGGEGRFFTPPLFGVTVLGSSHGFDPKGSTSGYVLWINRRGIMVDPPPHSTTILEKNQIHPSAIDGIIVTHVHGDHDAGAFQKILCERRVTVITSPTVYDAFIRKYAALSGIDADFLRRSHRFRPVRVGRELKLRGASFRFFYSLHSIPCLGFEVVFGGKSIVLSGDHMNDPARIQAMFEEGVLSEGRRDELLAFPWHHDLILHEAGIPPIHTPLATLEALPEDVKRRVHVVHVSEGAVREGSGLRAAKPGVRNTLELEVDVPEFSAAVSTLNLVNDIHFLSGLSLAHARGLLEIAFTRRFIAGQTVVAHGARCGDEFCVIITGMLEVSYALPEEGAEEDDKEPETPASPTALGREALGPPPAPAPCRKAVRWTIGDWFGEEVLMAPTASASPSASSIHLQREVRALTDAELLVFPGAELRYILQDMDIAARVRRRLLGGGGQLQLEELLARNFTLRSLTRTQKLHLEGIAQARHVARGEHVWRAGEPAGCCVLVQEGTLAYGGQAGRLMRSVGALLYARRRKSGSLSTSASSSPASPPAPPTLLCQGEDATQAPCPFAFEKGNLVGNPSLLLREGAAQPFDLVAVTDAALVVFPAEGMVDFFTQNPGVLLCLLDAEFVL